MHVRGGLIVHGLCLSLVRAQTVDAASETCPLAVSAHLRLRVLGASFVIYLIDSGIGFGFVHVVVDGSLTWCIPGKE